MSQASFHIILSFSGFIEALGSVGSKGILRTLKEVLRQPHNALTSLWDEAIQVHYWAHQSD